MIAFLVAGSASGVGKTTVSLSLMAAFQRRNKVVQAFKCGPDFLDTGHHTKVCDRPSRNLDTWMLSREANLGLYAKASRDADVVVVEGMMGLFDGVSGGGEHGSAAEIAKLLNLPVILVVDASKSGRSLAAVVKGFATFDPAIRFAGVVLNQVASERHFQLLEPAIKETCNLPILGWLPREKSISIPERHLGLHTAEEFGNWEQKREDLAAFAETHLDLNLLSEAAACLQIPNDTAPAAIVSGQKSVRIGVARDRAFSFYYEDNLDCLRELGAEIVPFSPMSDSNLPHSLDGLYFGGGYPELFAEALSSNMSMLDDIRAFAQAGRPVYGECGGMMYLAETLQTRDSRSFRMAGILPLGTAMTERLTRFGYTQLELTQDCLLGKKGTTTRGHSFHYSKCEPTQNLSTAYRIKYTLSGREEIEGYVQGSVLGSYVHLHFLANPLLAESFIEQARLRAGVTQ
jgi:cobyrinic acid a,c-diamide synthase